MENNGPIISRGDSPKDKLKRVLLIIVAFFFVGVYSLFTLASRDQNDDYSYEYESKPSVAEEQNLPMIIEDLSTEHPTEEKIEEEQTAEFYYERALDKEKLKDYKGAVEDYSKTIELAKKYSSEMWNALNNRGIIKAKQLKDYKGALTDFNRIIETETNRVDGNMNLTRLESGYTNRAYVKKMKGDKDGACDDLYLALGVSSTSSSAFIEKQIDKNCW
jgi:tetratricopeptide (TPR) repeat protein